MTSPLLLQLLLQVMLPLALLVAAGALWQHFSARHAVTLRLQLSSLALNLFVPALMFAIAAGARLAPGLLTVPLLLALGIVATGVVLYGLLFRSFLGRGLTDSTRAALMVAGMFGNILFVGLPVVTFLYGPQGARYPAFADIMAATPLVWTLGVWIATRLGSGAHGSGPRISVAGQLLRLPPVWGFAAGAAVNLAGWEVAPLVQAAHFIGQPTIPIMMFVLGLAIPWRSLRPSAAVLGVVAVKLLLMPLMVWGAAHLLFHPLAQPQTAAVIEAAMPTMLMAILFADRFKLDTGAAALMTGWSTLLFWLTLPFWLWILN
jgi:predicted permease